MEDERFVRRIAEHYIKLIVFSDQEEALEYLTRLEEHSPGIADAVADYLEDRPEITAEYE